MANPEIHPVTQVAVAVIVNDHGEVLLSRRAKDVHQGGLWEFPGGKVEPGESIEQALRRELLEELGIDVELAHAMMQIPFEYADKSVLLDVWRVDCFSGQASGLEGQAVEWLPLSRLRSRAFPAANRAIVHCLSLPGRYLITPAVGDDLPTFLAQLRRAIDDGVRLIQLRDHTLTEVEYRAVAAAVLALTQAYPVEVLLNHAAITEVIAGAAGLHLPSHRLMQAQSRCLPDHLWLACSCHTAEELAHAKKIGVDFAVMSPVKETTSHPEVCQMGWAQFEQVVSSVTLPVYALGGMTVADIKTAGAHGGQGIAAITGLWPSHSRAG